MDVSKKRGEIMPAKPVFTFLFCLIAIVINGANRELMQDNTNRLLWQATPGSYDELKQLGFRFMVYKNSISFGGRNMRVFLDEKAFSEENLRKLFKTLSKAFPEPMELDIDVITNLEQAYIFGEPMSSEDTNTSNSGNHYWAVYHRFKDNEYFRYGPNPSGGEVKTVVLKGRDPFAPR
jgi:hypothetical protein